MSQSELNIIQKLSAQASEPRAEFMHSLHMQVQKREQELMTNITLPRRNIMNFRKIAIGLVCLTLLAGATAYVLAGKFYNDDKNSQVVQSPSATTNTTQTSSLPYQQVRNLEQASKSLTFTPLLPTKQISGETLSAIKVGTKNGMIDDSDTIYLTFSDKQGVLFKMSQSSKTFNYPTDAEKVAIHTGEKSITANYYVLSVEETGGVNSVGGDVSTPSSYIFWSVDGVNYEVSEFGRVSKQQLIELASSLK